jgi:hypothetical protein
MPIDMTDAQGTAQCAVVVQRVVDLTKRTSNLVNQINTLATQVGLANLVAKNGQALTTQIASDMAALATQLEAMVANYGVTNQSLNPTTGQVMGPAIPIVIASFPTS